MSFNYLEVASAAENIAKELPAEVQSVEMLEFPVPQGLPDLNVGLRFTNRKVLVFSFKNPWIGVFYSGPGAFRPSKLSFASAFGGAQDWNSYLRGQSLETVSVKPNDRVMVLGFSNGAELTVEFFPARPNWILTVGGQEFCWREKGVLRPLARAAAAPPSTLTARTNDLYKHYLESRLSALLKTQLQRGQTELQSRLAQLAKVRGQMQEAMRESAKAEQCREQGETLKSILHLHPKDFRASSIEGIALDPQYSIADNANRYFAKYKKLQRTKKEVEVRLAGVEEQLKQLTSVVAKLRAFKQEPGESYEEAHKRLTEIVPAETTEPEKPLKKAEKKWQESGIRKTQSKEGLDIWVGRNHKENEELVIRLARGNDMWLHLKGRPGAHAIVRLSSGKSASLETLLDAATLVAYYSEVDKDEKVEVDYTFRKYVKRVPGNKDKFLVTYTQNKTLMVRVEESRLWRLLKQA